MTILVSTIYAVKYFDSSEIFDAEILQINQNGKFSVDLQIKNKINENLNFEIEVIYRQGNLVVSTDYLDCKTNCQINLEIDKIFFDKYTIQIRTFSAGRGYEKNLHFKYEKQEPTFKVTVPQEIYWDYKDLKIPIEFKSKNKNEISNYILDIYPTKRPEIKSTYTFQCMGTCIEEFIISKSILFGEYSINVYSNIDVLKLYFNVIPTNITKSQQQANGNITKSNLTQEQIKTIPELEFNQTINQSSNKTKDTSLEEILGYTKIEYNKYDLEESEEVESCIIYENLDEELKQERKKQISTALCKFDYKLNEVSENFEIKKIPSSIEMGDEFEFEITIPVGTNLNNSNFNLPEGFEIVAQKNFNLSENMPSKINALNSKFNSKLNQVTTQVAKSYLVKGTVTSLDDTVQIFENKGWLKKDLELNIKKSEELIEFEKVIKVNVDKIKNNISSGKSDLSLQKETSRIEFENIDLGSIDKVEVITKYELINYVPEVRNNLKTDIVNVIAKNFKNAKVILEKKQSGEITKILACEYFGENECLTGWEDSKYDIFQNETHVWFNTIHFSAYSGVGSGYIFDVDFESYAVTKIFQNNVENINVTVSCTMAGNCGTINVSLYTTGTPVNNFVDFESGFGSWSDTSESWCKWKLTSGKTPSRNTGPGGNIAGFDHTLGTSVGSFIFTESSNDWCRFRTATLTGTSFTVGSVESKISFWYHMAADNSPSHMGTLHFDVYDGSSWVNDVWSLSGVQQGSNDPFLFAEIDLSIFSGLINTRFRMSGVTVLTSWQGDLALDDIRIDSFGVPLTTLSSPPFKIDGIAQKQVSLLQGETKNVVFRVNATGLQGDIAEIYSLGVSSVDSLVKSLSNMKILTLPETVPPSGSKISPADTSTSVTKTVTFTSSVTDNSALSKATINIWNSNGNLVGSETKDVSETSDTATFDFSFTTEGAYTWNIFVEDISGNTAWLGINWSINLDFPGLGLNFINLPDNFQIIKDTTKNITVDISCTNANCGLTNVSLNTYFYSPPLFDDFESSIETIWTNVGGDDSNWWLEQTDNHKYGTRSTETGPSVDHTTGTGLGWLMYLETSDGYLEQNEFAYLESSTFTSSSSVTINFWYHMYASDNPTLTLEYHNGILWTEIWTTTGNLGDNWLNQEIELNYVGELKFRFTGTDNKNSYSADIALDDILITPKQYYFIDNISTTPAYVIGPSIQQVTLTDGTSATLTFELNATGFVGEEHYVIVRGQSNLDSNLDGQSQSKHLDIVDYFEVNVSQININPIIQTAGDSILITCKVENGFTGEAIDNYQVIFSSSRTGTIGTSYTDNLGFVYLNYTIPKTPTVSNISEDIICTIGNDVSKKYYALSQNFLSTQLNVTESAPWYTHWSITNGNAQDWTRKDIVRLSAIWKDNFNLSHMELEHNGVGTYTNYSKDFTNFSGPNLILDIDSETVSGSTIYDNSINSYDGTLGSGIVVNNSNPILGDYLTLDGTSSSFVTIPYYEELEISDSGGSVFMWFKMDSDLATSFPSNTYSRGLIYLRGHSNKQVGSILGLGIFKWSSLARLSLHAGLSGSGKLETTTYLSAETWYQAGIVWNSTDYSIYLNSKKIGTKSRVGNITLFGNYPLYFGHMVTIQGTAKGNFIGDIDEMKLFNYTLSDTEIYNLYNSNIYHLDFTNFTQFPNVGPIRFNAMYGVDNFDWATKTSPSYDLNLYGFADISQILPIPAAVGAWGESSTVYCEIKDNDTGIPIQNYPVSFNSDLSGPLGTNTTDILGRAYMTDIITADTTFSCSIADEQRLYYYANKNYDSVLISRDQIAPTYSNWGFKYLGGGDIADGTNINNTELVYVHSLWQDNYQLYTGYLTHSGSGTNNNYSINSFPTILDSIYSWANQTLEFTNSTQFSQVGRIDLLGMTISDKADNTDTTTPSKYFYLYGFANASKITVSESIYGPNTTIIISCKITDSTHKGPIENYNVNIISNETGLISTIQTNSSGIASTTYTDTTPGQETISCNIIGDTYYYVNQSSISTQVFYDNSIPSIISGYGLSSNIFHPSESVTLSALWSESINSSEIYTDEENFVVSSYTNNVTLGTITSTLSWAKGPHDVSFVNTIDQNNNINYSVQNLTLDLYHYADIVDTNLLSSSTDVNSTMYYGCRVQDMDTNNYIDGYEVRYYEDGVFVGSDLTDTDGWSYSSHIPNTTGTKTIKCKILLDSVNYYDPTIPSYETFSSNVSSLSGRVCETDILSVSYNNYFDTALEDGFILTGTNCVSGSNNNFVSWLNQVSGTADSDSGVSSDYKIFHSNGVLDIGPELQLGCINGNNRQDSYTHLYKDINPASLIGFKILFYYTDRSGGNGLELDSSPNNVVSFSYNSNQNSVNSTTYISETFTPIISTCSGEDNTGLGATAYYQEVDEYGLIQSMIDEGLSSIDLRLALYANSNYDGGNDLARWHYNEFELYTKQLSVVMLTPISTIESYENKSESLTCVVQTSGTNTSNVDLYPQFCSGDSCTSFTNIQSNSGAIRVNESSYACTDSHCSKTFNINYSEEGTYNLRCSSTNFDSYTVASTSEQLTVYNSDLIISDISHDQNNNSEFEIGDKINHINVSIKNSIRGKSYSPSVEINLINSSSQTPVWSTQFPQIGYCSNPMLQNTTCNLTFKNSDNGFIIDTSAKEGIYNISTTLLWENSGNIIQSNKSIKIFNLNNRFTSVVDNPSIIEGTSTIIRVNFTNPTSNNLTNLQLTLNCPVGFNCTNSNTHLVVLPNQTIISNFTISSTLSTPITSHNFTFDVTYNNIRGFSKSWSNITSTSILVKSDIFVVTLRHYKINKTITSLSQNNYSVNLQVINLQNFNQSISLIDFVDSQSKTSNFNFPINSSKIILGPKFNGTINIWNFTLTNFQSININYTLTINSTYSNMLNNYIIGLS